MRTRTKILIGLFVTMLLVVAAVFFWHNSVPDFARTPLPVPNGYGDITQAGSTIQKEPSDFTKLSETELRELVGANSNALQMARAGLGKKIQVPVEFSISYITNHTSSLLGIRAMGHLFVAESKVAESEKRFQDGANSCLDAIRVGIECRSGGLFVDALIGIAVENLGTTQLEHFVDSLDAKSCREIAKTLEDLDAQKQSWGQILRQDHYWSRRMFPGGWQSVVAGWFMHKQIMAEEAKGERRFNTQEAKTQSLMIEFASRAYELENGHRPNSTHDLVPGYLKAIPQNPFAGASPPP
jgi:hypothetical protein